MSTRHLLHPELQSIADLNFEFEPGADSLPAFREAREKMFSLTEPDESVKTP